MELIRALSLASIVGLTGCSGFVSGLKHGLTGMPPEQTEQSKPGYDYGTMAANALVAFLGYAARHFQDKVIPPKKDAPPQ